MSDERERSASIHTMMGERLPNEMDGVPPEVVKAVRLLSLALNGISIPCATMALASMLMTVFVNGLPGAPDKEEEDALRDIARETGKRLIELADIPANIIQDAAHAMGDNQPKH